MKSSHVTVPGCLPGPDGGVNPRYLAWAAKHGNSPEQQLAQDKRDWPGGCMVGFSLWIRDMVHEFAGPNVPEGMTGAEWGALQVQRDQDGFTAFLLKRAAEDADK